MRICVGEWFQRIYPLIGVDDVDFAPPYYKVCECNGVEDVLVFVPSNNGICTKVPVEEAGYDTDGTLIAETPEFTTVYT